ncbi:MAG: hypothetical protein WAK40_06770 [Thermoplasmata archaeon]
MTEGAASPSELVIHRRRRELRHRRNRRATISLGALGVVLVIGTIGFHAVSGTGAVESFYFESMLATGQGPPLFLTSATAQLFASGMAFLSVGTVVTALILNLGPMLARLWREGVELAEKEIRKFEGEISEEIRGANRKE